MAWRTAGKVGCGGGPLILFFPLRRFEAAVLQESIGDHRHQRMTVKTLPGSSFEMIKAEFFFHLLVSLLAYPSRLDGGRQGAQIGRRRQIGEVIFFLSRHPMFADEPSFLARQMLLTLVPDPLWCPSATRTRTAANRALSLPFVPVRQLMVCHLAVATRSSAALDRILGTCRFRGRPRRATGQIIRTSAGYALR